MSLISYHHFIGSPRIPVSLYVKCLLLSFVCFPIRLFVVFILICSSVYVLCGVYYEYCEHLALACNLFSHIFMVSFNEQRSSSFYYSHRYSFYGLLCLV